MKLVGFDALADAPLAPFLIQLALNFNLKSGVEKEKEEVSHLKAEHVSFNYFVLL